MRDAERRALERSGQLGDPAAAAQALAAGLRARDPRLDPRAGDRVEVHGELRQVEILWPQVLTQAVPAARFVDDERGHRDPANLGPGTLVAIVGSGRLRRGGPRVWRFTAAREAAVWLRFEADHAPVFEAPEPGTATTDVTWSRPRVGRRRRHENIEEWRRWAQDGRVLRLGV